MQIFRLMGMPDKVIAFDELPERLVQGFEMCKADGFPRHWKEWMGKKKRMINIPPEKDFLTGQIRRFPPIIEEESFFYLVDWTIKPIEEKWQEVCDFVRQHVSKDVRLMDNIVDMAKPLAPDKLQALTLEPEEVPIILIPIQYQEKIEEEPEQKVLQRTIPEKKEVVHCDIEGCKAEFKDKRGIYLHKRHKHKPEAIAA